MTAEIPLVSVSVPSGGGLLAATARLLGKPTRREGKPTAAEVLLESGRYTLVSLKYVEAINDAARVVLEAPGPERSGSA